MTGTARIYARLSDYSKRSIPGQIRDGKDYAERNGYHADRVYNEGQGASGWNDNREEYLQMLEDAENDEFDILIVRDGSRLGRSYKERIRAFLDLDDWGVEFHTVERGFVNPDDQGDVLTEVFKSMNDDFGKRGEVERLEAEMERRRENEWFIGEPPSGLQYDESKKYVIADKNEIDDVLRVYELRGDGATYREIAEEVPWSPPTVGKLIKRREQYEAAANGAVLGHQLQIVEI